MTSITKMKIAIVLAGVLLLVFPDGLLACHNFGEGSQVGMFNGHSGLNVMREKRRGGRSNSAFGFTTHDSTASSEGTSASIQGSFYITSDSTATSTNCNWRAANIEKFFNDSYEQIAEESAQGSGQHLEALASLTGCSAEQYGTFETAMNRNHRYVFADKDYDGSINNFFAVLNTDEDLLQCWGQS